MTSTNKTIKTAAYGSLEGMCFKLREAEHIKHESKEWSLKLQFIEAHTIIFAASGHGMLTIDGQFIELREGSLYVFFPGQLIEAAAQSFDERGFYFMRFDVMKDDGVSLTSRSSSEKSNHFPVIGELIPTSQVSIGALCDTICRYVKDDEPLNRFRAQILFQEILHTLLQDALLDQETDSDAALEHVKTYIEQHYQQELTIEQLARVAGISSRHFMRLFKKRYGCSAIDYLAAYRIKQAQQLMRTGGQYRIRDIARHVGYQDDIYFRRKFKQISGLPPAAFIKNSKQKIVAYHSLIIGELLALHATPSAAPADHPWTDYYRRKYESSAVLPLSTLPSTKIEQLRAAVPDFIIGTDLHISTEEQTLLQEIAPSFFVPWTGNDWRTHLRLIAQFLGKSSVAETWLENYERKARFVSEQIKGVNSNERLLILRISGERYTALGRRSIATVFYDDLQLRSARSDDHMQTDQPISAAQLEELDADRLLLLIDEDPLSQSSWQALMLSDQWRSLNAVREGRLIFLPSYPWIEYTAFTHDLILDEVLKLWRDRT
ncbi:AraC family transcriptional regulator [Paenibacillus sinopodophylli]|uniref:AraC family transcriptional regulator n=1 Tax=Paenibacillus sinopodophylli TaxID=1837342 RepID=UPI00110CB233|nr:AraC family transcriptional regulator [Paenibacillus sinopodophylli]